MKISTVSEFDEIRLCNKISQYESNGEVRFVIRNLENFQVYNLYYNDNLPFCYFSEKFDFSGVLQFVINNV